MQTLYAVLANNVFKVEVGVLNKKSHDIRSWLFIKTFFNIL